MVGAWLPLSVIPYLLCAYYLVPFDRHREKAFTTVISFYLEVSNKVVDLLVL
jgi:hypothetical protein